jgi:hypothetical protein
VLIASVIIVSIVALDFRADPEKFTSKTIDRTAMRHVDSGERHGRKMKVRKRVLDPRSDEEREMDELDARIRLLWARVERLETEILASNQEERANA